MQWISDGQGGFHPEPPQNPNAPDLESLRYLAALTTARCGVDCRIGQLNGPDVYDYAVYSPDGAWSQSGNCGEYWQAREFLHGMEAGALATRRLENV